MKNLSSIEKLDSLFAYLYKKGSQYTKYRDIVAEHFAGNETENDVEGMLIKLDKDGCVDTGQHKITTLRMNEETDFFDFLRDFLAKNQWTEQTTYKLSYEGRFLFENSHENKPYRSLKKKEQRKQAWVITKTIAAVLNAAAIVVIAFFALKAQREANSITTRPVSDSAVVKKVN